ncbi:MAG: hypothetical protein ACRDL5_17715 [Solirubrobacteraceae bacterium]
MEVLLLTRPHGNSAISCQRGGALRRLRTRMHAWRLDVALAGGASPDASAALSLRARELIGRRARSQLAGEIERLLIDACRPAPPRRLCVVPCRDQLLDAEPTLRELSARLRDAGPIDASGVARIRLLLRDGAGPIYNRARAGELQRMVDAALEATEPRLPDDDD